MRDAFTRALMREAAKDPKLTLVTGDLGFGVLKPFWETYPDQFINAGIAEIPCLLIKHKTVVLLAHIHGDLFPFGCFVWFCSMFAAF